MIRHYLTSISPDSTSGIIFAMESVVDGTTLLNGPTGCKFYHGAVADYKRPFFHNLDPLDFPEEYYFGQPRVPCTFLDKRDYVYGSREKLIEGLRFIEKQGKSRFVAIVNGPGAALIGDDLEGIIRDSKVKIPVLAVESPGFSEGFITGYKTGIMRLISFFENSCKKEKEAGNSVNILGLSIYDNYIQGDKEEIKRLLSLCNIDINCFLGCDSDVEQLKNIGRASLNIVINGNYGLDAAKILKEKYNTPYYCCKGIPVGFSPMENMIKDVCIMLNINPNPALEEIIKARKRNYMCLERFSSITGLPATVPFSLEGNYCQVFGYASFLMEYLGMIPASISIKEPKHIEGRQEVIRLLENYKCIGALDKDILNTPCEVILADGNTISKLKLSGIKFSGIEISLPSIGYTNVIPKTHIGAIGGMLLTEQVINGIRMD